HASVIVGREQAAAAAESGPAALDPGERGAADSMLERVEALVRAPDGALGRMGAEDAGALIDEAASLQDPVAQTTREAVGQLVQVPAIVPDHAPRLAERVVIPD